MVSPPPDSNEKTGVRQRADVAEFQLLIAVDIGPGALPIIWFRLGSNVTLTTVIWVHVSLSGSDGGALQVASEAETQSRELRKMKTTTLIRKFFMICLRVKRLPTQLVS